MRIVRQGEAVPPSLPHPQVPSLPFRPSSLILIPSFSGTCSLSNSPLFRVPLLLLPVLSICSLDSFSTSLRYPPPLSLSHFAVFSHPYTHARTHACTHAHASTHAGTNKQTASAAACCLLDLAAAEPASREAGQRGGAGWWWWDLHRCEPTRAARVRPLFPVEKWGRATRNPARAQMCGARLATV